MLRVPYTSLGSEMITTKKTGKNVADKKLYGSGSKRSAERKTRFSCYNISKSPRENCSSSGAPIHSRVQSSLQVVASSLHALKHRGFLSREACDGTACNKLPVLLLTLAPRRKGQHSRFTSCLKDSGPRVPGIQVGSLLSSHFLTPTSSW